ncbi:MAG TPA: hypothetical protein VFJ68_03690, partial [Casimicrobiaceae bacterium]|nr:hypothetical protein [Casimicrobiaceae bacterium]
VAAALRTAASGVRLAATRLDEATGAGEIETACACDSCGSDAEDMRELDGLAHLNAHVLKDIGAPHWLVAHAAAERDREHVRWLGFENR